MRSLFLEEASAFPIFWNSLTGRYIAAWEVIRWSADASGVAGGGTSPMRQGRLRGRRRRSDAMAVLRGRSIVRIREAPGRNSGVMWLVGELAARCARQKLARRMGMLAFL